MFYKPNYCCNCGEKIERVDWGILTSRRFCQLCATEQNHHEWLVRFGFVGTLLVGLVLGFGLFSGGNEQNRSLGKSKEKPTDSVKSALIQSSGEKLVSHDVAANKVENIVKPASGAITPSVTAADANTLAVASEYFCGALTKKGTACSRRVKAKGLRCWQHVGKPTLEDAAKIKPAYDHLGRQAGAR